MGQWVADGHGDTTSSCYWINRLVSHSQADKPGCGVSPRLSHGEPHLVGQNLQDQRGVQYKNLSAGSFTIKTQKSSGKSRKKPCLWRGITCFAPESCRAKRRRVLHSLGASSCPCHRLIASTEGSGTGLSPDSDCCHNMHPLAFPSTGCSWMTDLTAPRST